MSEAPAQYKKQDGILAISADGQLISWRSARGDPQVDINIADISSMCSPWINNIDNTNVLTIRPSTNSSNSCESLSQNCGAEVARSNGKLHLPVHFSIGTK